MGVDKLVPGVVGGCGAEQRDRVIGRQVVAQPAELGDPVDGEAGAVAVAA